MMNERSVPDAAVILPLSADGLLLREELASPPAAREAVR